MSLKVRILGSGNSSGVPAIGNYWGNCNPEEPRNRRSRCSLAVQSDKTTIVIDTAPELRQQTALFDISIVDGVFYSHHHSDHSHGIHDLRTMFFFKDDPQPIPCYGSELTLDKICYSFDFMFSSGRHEQLYPPVLKANRFSTSQYGKPQKFRDITYMPFEMDHGTCMSVGYRFGDLSYCVDMKRLNDKALRCIEGSRVWIVDGSGYHNSENPVHAELETVYRYNKIIGAQEVYITSLTPQMDYQMLLKELPEGFYPAYDGLMFDVEPHES